MTLGIKLRTIRKNNKLTLKQLGELVGLSEQAIGQYERGDRNPSIDILNKIATAIGVTVNDLIKDDTIDITNMNDDEKLSSKTIPGLFEEMRDIMCNELCKYADTVDEEGMCEQGRTGGCPLRKYF